MLSSRDVAEYFLAQTDEEEGDYPSNLKVQKLIYYAQGFHLAIHNVPLFEEEIEAWLHGPVVPELYREYRVYGSGPIPPPQGFDYDKFLPDTRDLLDDVYNVYGQYSAWKLRQMTHTEAPWKDVFEEDMNHVISKESLATFFATRLA